MLIEQIVEFELRGHGPPGRICTSITAYLYDMTKQKSLRNIVEWIILLLTAAILQEQCTLLPPTWTKSRTNLTQKCKVLIAFWT